MPPKTPLDILAAIPDEQIPAAIAALAARAMQQPPTARAEPSEDWLTAEQVAELLKLPSRRSAYRLSRKFGAVRLGRKLRFSKTTVLARLKSLSHA